MRTAEVAANIVGNHAVTVVDVGARWGADGAWYALAPLARMVGFEPDPTECARLNAQAKPGQLFVPLALGDARKTATLHVTKDPACSSLFAPSREVTSRYRALHVMEPASTIPVTTERLDDWAAEDGRDDVAFLKLDVQGAELLVLEGAPRVLSRAVGLELEVEFSALYDGQPLFGDIDAFLRARGFTLWRLGNLVHYTETDRHRTPHLGRRETSVFNGVHVSAEAGAGRLFWGHALYFRDYRTLPTASSELPRHLALAALLDAAGDADGRDAALQWVMAVHSWTSETKLLLTRHMSALASG